eukprot:UN16359
MILQVFENHHFCKFSIFNQNLIVNPFFHNNRKSRT